MSIKEIAETLYKSFNDPLLFSIKFNKELSEFSEKESKIVIQLPLQGQVFKRPTIGREYVLLIRIIKKLLEEGHHKVNKDNVFKVVVTLAKMVIDN